MRVRILSQKAAFLWSNKNNNKGSQIKNIEIFNFILFITQILEDNKH